MESSFSLNDVSSDTGHLVADLDSVESLSSKITTWLNPAAQSVGFVAGLHLLETCLQPESYTHAPSQARKFLSPKASLVMVSFSSPSVMKCWPFLAVPVHRGWWTRGPGPAAWKSGLNLDLTEEIQRAVVGPKVVAFLIRKQHWGRWWRRAKTELSSLSTGLSKRSVVGCHHSAGIFTWMKRCHVWF